MFGILICLVVITLASAVTSQQAQPYQYSSQYQNAYNSDRHTYSHYAGFRPSSSLAPNNGESVKFPDAHLSPASTLHGFSNQNTFVGRTKKDMSAGDRSNEVSTTYQSYAILFTFWISEHKFITRVKFLKYFSILIWITVNLLVCYKYNFRWIIRIFVCVGVAQAYFFKNTNACILKIYLLAIGKWTQA